MSSQRHLLTAPSIKIWAGLFPSGCTVQGHTGGLHCRTHLKGGDASVVNYVKSQTPSKITRNNNNWRRLCSSSYFCTDWLHRPSLLPWPWLLPKIRTAAQTCPPSCRHQLFVCQSLQVPPVEAIIRSAWQICPPFTIWVVRWFKMHLQFLSEPKSSSVGL